MSSVQDPILDKITAWFKAEYSPLRIFLYGSRAQGTHRPDSDYDFVLVVPKNDKRDRYRVMASISSILRQKFDVEVQAWIYSEAEFNDWKDEFSSIPETALNTGIEIELG